MKYCPDDDGAVQCDGDIRGLLDELENLPPAQPEHDAEFWRKRAEEYSNICIAMTDEMTKGIKFNSIRIDENGICFGKEQPEQIWIPCSERLPDTNRDVLLQFSASMGVGFWEHNGWGVNTGDNIYSEIGEKEAQPIAWCELPEQYQGGGKQE